MCFQSSCKEEACNSPGFSSNNTLDPFKSTKQGPEFEALRNSIEA